MSMPPEDLQPDERLPEELRGLRLGRPRPALRQDTLRALRSALDEPSRAPRWWESWRVELTLGATTAAACCLLSFCLGSPTCQLPETLVPVSPPPVVASMPVAAELEELGPYASRAHRARRNTERRTDHAILTYDDTTKSSRFRWYLRWTLGLILALVLLDLVALQLARSALHRAAEQAETEGSSLDLSVLLAEVDTPPAENAHGYLQAAGQLFAALDETSGKHPDKTLRLTIGQRLRRGIRLTGETPTAEDLELFRLGVDHFGLVLDALDAALPMEEAHVDLDHYGPIFDNAHVPELLRRIWMSDLLSARARLAAAGGNGDEAWRDIHAMFRLATWTSQERPTLIDRLIATALVRFATLEAMALLRTDVPDSGEMEDLLAEARRWDPQATYDLALEVERALMVTSFLDEKILERIARGEMEDWFGEIPPWLLSRPLRPWVHWNLAVLSDAMTDLFADCRQPTYRRAQDVDHYVPSRMAILARAMVSQGLAQNLLDACKKRDRTLVDVDLMEIAFRLEEHRRQSGSYPSSLDALAKVPSPDPFSGEPYVYRLTAGGAVVYSVGMNREDDGGTPPPFTSKRGEDRYSGDLVWRLGE